MQIYFPIHVEVWGYYDFSMPNKLQHKISDYFALRLWHLKY